MELLIENAGRSTFLVYKMRENDELDSIGLGMIENNSISGILPIALNHYDDDRRLSFNISSQISLTKLLMGKISRKKILTILSYLIQMRDIFTFLFLFLWEHLHKLEFIQEFQ